MLEKLIKTNEVAEMISASPKITRKWLEEHGIQPVQMGRGRGRGLRWPLSCVQTLIKDERDAAQAGGKKNKVKRSIVAEISASDLFELTTQRAIQ
ncbi:MAG: hypothetical protein IJU76_11395 [Desulfovibrionaceae bacterium]|nr:hypothetical protein [Desulfovibrionaceae bacterium]